MSKESLKQFQRKFIKNTNLQERVKATSDKDSFIRLLVNLGEEAGYSFTYKEVEESIQEQAQDPDLEINPRTVENAIEQFKSEVMGPVVW